MSPKNQGKATKKQVVEPERSKANPKTSKRAWALNSGLVISNVLYNVAEFAPIPALKYAAQAVATFLGTVEKVQTNKEDFQIIADDASDLIIAIFRLQEKSKNPKKWTSPEIRDMVGNLKTALEKVTKIANRQANRNLVTRAIFNMTDAGRIRQTREKINAAVSQFQVISHIKLNELLLEVAATQQELAQDVKDLKTDRVEEAEEAEEEEEGSSHLPQNQTTGPAPNSMGIHDFSFSNGSGNMYNSNVGNIVNNNISNVGNNNSRNYYGY